MLIEENYFELCSGRRHSMDGTRLTVGFSGGAEGRPLQPAVGQFVLCSVASTGRFESSCVPAFQPGQELFGLPGDLLSVLGRHAC